MSVFVRPLRTLLCHRLFSCRAISSTRKPSDKKRSELDEGDKFGCEGGREVLSSEYLPDDDDKYDSLEKMKRRRPFQHYNFLLWRLRDAGGPEGMRKAIQVFERMFREDRYEPDRKIFTIMISGCAQFGLVEKAFYFFDMMQKNKVKPSKATVTALLNACAESRHRDKGLEKLEVITEWIRESSYPCNMIQYNAMVKAYAKLGDLKSAFAVTKDMKQEGHELNDQTYCMLLMGCITDRETGLSHAIRILRQMRSQMQLTVHAMNLFLRIVRDSGFGSEQHIRKLMPESVQNNVTFVPSSQIQNLNLVSVSNQLLPSPVDLLRQSFPQKNLCLDMSSLRVYSNKLALVGGVPGIMRLIDESNIKPTVATIGALIDVMPYCIESERHIILDAEKRGVTLDTDTFNKLVRRQAIRKDLTAAKETLREMQLRHLSVDIVTFGCLALACCSRELGLQLLQDMKDAGFKLNKEIGGALVHQSSSGYDFDYATHVLIALERDAVRPDPRMLQELEEAQLAAGRALLQMEKGKTVAHCFRNLTSESLDRFKLFYSSWLKRSTVDFPEPEERQFDFKISPNPRQGMFEFEKDMRRRISEIRGTKFWTARRKVDGVDVERELERQQIN